MTRRLLGYVVKLHDGTRSPRTPKPVSLANIVLPWCSGRAAEPLVVVPVFAVRKPKAAPAVAGERYACLVTRSPAPNRLVGAFVPVSDLGQVGSKDAATRTLGEVSVFPEENAEVVCILAYGAHEAAVAKAREEGAEAAISYVALRMAKAAEAGDVSMRSVEEFDDIVAAYRLKAEAAKGCAK